ncbi:MAG: CDP-alcohol phosphatidyltransferase family protein [Anaerolineales bacterium]|nr:CDP-alcohol phosphatidyltransferase family protein [Anaerolineales bacterium]
MNNAFQPSSKTLTDYLRIRFKHLLDPAGEFLNRIGIAPNTLTLAGLIGNLIGSLLVARGQFVVGGFILLFMGPLDALDGTMARLRGEPTDFGAFIDSVTDRYSELIIFAGLLYFYLSAGNSLMAILVFAASAGSVLVSYVRARAQSLGYEAKQGVLTRAERFVVLIPSIILGYPSFGVVIVALLANFTALQRILVVRRLAR